MSTPKPSGDCFSKQNPHPPLPVCRVVRGAAPEARVVPGESGGGAEAITSDPPPPLPPKHHLWASWEGWRRLAVGWGRRRSSPPQVPWRPGHNSESRHARRCAGSGPALPRLAGPRAALRASAADTASRRGKARYREAERGRQLYFILFFSAAGNLETRLVTRLPRIRHDAGCERRPGRSAGGGRGARGRSSPRVGPPSPGPGGPAFLLGLREVSPSAEETAAAPPSKPAVLYLFPNKGGGAPRLSI